MEGHGRKVERGDQKNVLNMRERRNFYFKFSDVPYSNQSWGSLSTINHCNEWRSLQNFHLNADSVHKLKQKQAFGRFSGFNLMNNRCCFIWISLKFYFHQFLQLLNVLPVRHTKCYTSTTGSCCKKNLSNIYSCTRVERKNCIGIL